MQHAGGFDGTVVIMVAYPNHVYVKGNRDEVCIARLPGTLRGLKIVRLFHGNALWRRQAAIEPCEVGR